MKQFAKSIISVILSLIILMTSITAFAENKFGIDVSYHNGTVDYVKEAENGTSFVMIRLGYYNHLDTMFWENVQKAAEAQMNFGVYLYSYAYNLEEAQIEADFVIDTLSQIPQEYKKYFTLPVAYDMEDEKLTQFSKQQLTQQAVYFCDEMSYAGYTPMVYANLNWFNNYLDFPQLVTKGYKFWYANYTNNPNFDEKKQIGTTGVYADIWQYQSGENHESGIDQNIAYDLDSLMHKYSLSSETPLTCTTDGKRTYICSICEEKIETTKKAVGHSYNSGVVTVKANCNKAGTKTYTCTVCKATKTETIAKTAHTYKTYTTKATTSKNGNVINKCSVCGYVKSKSTVYYPKSITLSATSYTYDGKVKKPTVKVVASNGKTISSSNYTVSYASGRKYVGKYAVKITFKGNYSGSKTLYFTIKPKSTSISKLSSLKKGFKVTWNKKTSQTTGYQIQYSTSSKFKNAKTVTVSKNSTTSKTISKLTAKKKYYVRVRTYKTVNGVKYYSSWSSYKSVTTKK